MKVGAVYAPRELALGMPNRSTPLVALRVVGPGGHAVGATSPSGSPAGCSR